MKLLLYLVFLGIFTSLVSSTPEPAVEYEETEQSSVNFKIYDLYKFTNFNNEFSYSIPYTLEAYRGANTTRIHEMMHQIGYDISDSTCVSLQPRTLHPTYIRIRFYESYTINNQHPRICASSTPGSDWRSNIIYVDMSCSNPQRNLIDELARKLAYQHEDIRPDSDHYKDVLNGRRSSIPSYDIYSESYYQHLYTTPQIDDNQIKEDRFGLNYNAIKAINEQYQCSHRHRRIPRYSGCSRSDLPPILGGGSYYPDLNVYENKQVIKLICDEGYEVVGSQYLWCQGDPMISQFPEHMVCQKVTCKDNLDHCQSIMEGYNEDYSTPFCDERRYYDQCMKTCGRCEGESELCTRIPKVYGYGEILPLKRKYYSGEVIRMECAEGYHPAFNNTATCTNGQFNKEYFQCLPELPPSDEDFLCNRIHPGEDESETKCLKFYEKTHCSPLELDVGPGHFVPAQPLYNIHDVIQLVCDDYNQYVIESSGVARCEINKISGLPYWSHTDLKCVPRNTDECVDDSDICTEISPEDCDSPRNVQFTRLHCKHKCGHCEGRNVCNETPYYDRRVSTISPMKHVYKLGDEVTLECHPGYKSSNCNPKSYCRNGYFWPRKLECVPVTGSCPYKPMTDEIVQRSEGGRSYFMAHYPQSGAFFPRLQSYPPGFKVVRNCLNGNNGGSEGNFDEFTCTTVNGEHILSGNTQCDGTYTCSSKRLFEDLKLLEIKPPALRDLYRNGEYIYIECGFKFGKMRAVCTDGRFHYYETCKNMRDERKKFLEERSCRAADLPRVYGRGWITPQKQIYQHKEVITLNCELGTTSNTESFTTCNNGKFDRDIFICSDDTCDGRENCERKGCTTKGAGAVKSPMKELYRHGEHVTIECVEDYDPEELLCNDGSFGINEPLCQHNLITSSEIGYNRLSQNICKLMIRDCDKQFVQLYCKNTCKWKHNRFRNPKFGIAG